MRETGDVDGGSWGCVSPNPGHPSTVSSQSGSGMRQEFRIPESEGMGVGVWAQISGFEGRGKLVPGLLSLGGGQGLGA